MFGFKIIRQRKKDIEELGVLKNTISNLNRDIQNLHILIASQGLIKSNGIQQGLNLIESIKVDILIYADNRFSTPLQTYSIVDTVSTVSKLFRSFIDLSFNIVYLCGDSPKTDEELKQDSELLVAVHKYQNAKQLLIINLRKLVHIMLYDNERINLGVNIIDDYYKHRNIKPPRTSNDMSFTVSFISPDKAKSNIKQKNEE